jgi:hypothetical protein
VNDARIIAIGDGIGTDIRARWARISTACSSPAAREETGTGSGASARPDVKKLAAFLDKAGLEPTFAISALS